MSGWKGFFSKALTIVTGAVVGLLSGLGFHTFSIMFDRVSSTTYVFTFLFGCVMYFVWVDYINLRDKINSGELQYVEVKKR